MRREWSWSEFYKQRLFLAGAFLIIVGIVILISCFVGCGAEQGVPDYLMEIDNLTPELGKLAKDVSALYNNSAQMDSRNIFNKCKLYSEECNHLLCKLSLIECPNECLRLHQYLIDGLTYHAKEITEYGAYYTTWNEEHLINSVSYYHDSQRAIALAVAEHDSLMREYCK